MSEMEAPERKKLKPTYQPAVALAPLPSGWTEHTAPTGHKYYYNASTKKSTYTRPVAAPTPPVEQAPAPAFSHSPAFTPSPAPGAYSAPQDYAALAQAANPNVYNAYNGHVGGQPYNIVPGHPYNATHPYSAGQSQSWNAGPGQPFNNAPYAPYQDFNRRPQHQRRPPPGDRPKKKAIIPNCSPWILVYTKLGRRFVHNPTTKESFWKFPPDVMTAVVEYDKQELEKKLAAKNKDEGTGANNVPVGNNNRQRRRSQSLQREDEAALAAMALEDNEDEVEEGKVVPAKPTNPEKEDDGNSSSEYEEVEVTDSEGEEGDEDETHNPAHPDGEEPSGPPDSDQPVEFGEEDIAYQLAQMGAQYGLDPGEYDDGTLSQTYEEGAEGLPLSEEDTYALFADLLNDHQISPFSPWENLLENIPLISDERWTILPTTKSRHEAWDKWTREAIATLKLQRANQEKLDPRIPYLSLLAEKATPKLYWMEFKRKFRKESALSLATSKFGDKEKEKLYRDYISRLKLPEKTRKSDFVALLRSLDLKTLNRDSRIDALPKELLVDLRFYCLSEHLRTELLKAHLSTLPSAPEGGDEGDEEERKERERLARERERRERALRERERRVAEEKRRVERDLQVGRGMLREGEREIQEAMRVGREGLRGQLDGGDDDVDGARVGTREE